MWRSLLARDFPGSAPLAASQAKGWRHAYQLEAAGVPGDLCCWYSRASAAEAVLGLPLRYTVNPRTREIDYIEADMELLAVDAFKAGQWRAGRARLHCSGSVVQSVQQPCQQACMQHVSM